MSFGNFARETNGSPPVLRVVVVAAFLAICTCVILDNAIRYRGSPSDAEVTASAERQASQKRRDEQMKPINETWAARTIVGNRDSHERLLRDLQKAVGPQGQSRCTRENRRALREALVNYVSARSGAERSAAKEPLLLGIDAVWKSSDDAGALKDAHYILEQG